MTGATAPCPCTPCLCFNEVDRLESGIEQALEALQSGRTAEAKAMLADLVDGTDPEVAAIWETQRQMLILQWLSIYGPRQPFLEWAHTRRGAA